MSCEWVKEWDILSALKWPWNDHLAVNYPRTLLLFPSQSHLLVFERRPPLVSQVGAFVSTDLHPTFSSRNPKQKEKQFGFFFDSLSTHL